MRHPLRHNILLAAPALLVYALLLPLAAKPLDHHLRLGWPLPGWCGLAGLVLVLVGAALAMWSVWLLFTRGDGTPNPLAPPQKLVSQGPYRHSRNPMMLGGWVAGLGLAVVLRSPSLLAAYAVIVVAGCLYVRYIEEPRLHRRFGAAYAEYVLRVPRWVGCGFGEARGLSHHTQDG